MAFQAVFKRYELKYLLTAAQKEAVLAAMANYMQRDKYGRTVIRNLYYDTDTYLLIRCSLEKPVYKEKLRLRSYGVVTPEDKVFLEIKKKYKKKVNKRRTKLKLAEAYAFAESGELPKQQTYMNAQVLRELQYLLKRMNMELKPALFLSYDRVAMFGKDNKDFRITFDRNITTRRYDLGLHYGIYGEKLLPEDEWIMEVKIEDAMPLWMTKILSEFRIYPTSFSKYGTEYTRYMLGLEEKDEDAEEAAMTDERMYEDILFEE